MDTTGELRIVAFGDSITAATTGNWPVHERWLARTESGLRALFPERSISAINAGVGGNTAREGWARFERDVAAHEPSVVLIEFGGNDATPEPDRHVGLDEFQDLLNAIIGRCRGLGAEPVLLPFPPVIDLWHVFWARDTFHAAGGLDRTIEQYRRVTRAVATREGVPLIDIDRALRAAMDRFGVDSQIMPDGVHLTPGGNVTVALAIIAGLAQWLAHTARIGSRESPRAE